MFGSMFGMVFETIYPSFSPQEITIREIHSPQHISQLRSPTAALKQDCYCYYTLYISPITCHFITYNLSLHGSVIAVCSNIVVKMVIQGFSRLSVHAWNSSQLLQGGF